MTLVSSIITIRYVDNNTERGEKKQMTTFIGNNKDYVENTRYRLTGFGHIFRPYYYHHF